MGRIDRPEQVLVSLLGLVIFLSAGLVVLNALLKFSTDIGLNMWEGVAGLVIGLLMMHYRSVAARIDGTAIRLE